MWLTAPTNTLVERSLPQTSCVWSTLELVSSKDFEHSVGFNDSNCLERRSQEQTNNWTVTIPPFLHRQVGQLSRHGQGMAEYRKAHWTCAENLKWCSFYNIINLKIDYLISLFRGIYKWTNLVDNLVVSWTTSSWKGRDNRPQTIIPRTSVNEIYIYTLI